MVSHQAAFDAYDGTWMLFDQLSTVHPIETVGAQLRDMMPWIKANKLVDQSKN